MSIRYCLSKNSLHILYRNVRYEIGQDFLVIQYLMISSHEKYIKNVEKVVIECKVLYVQEVVYSNLLY